VCLLDFPQLQVSRIINVFRFKGCDVFWASTEACPKRFLLGIHSIKLLIGFSIMLQDGQRLGEFEILAKLGQGGMGAVYKARQTVLRRLVAIKTLQPSLSSDAEFVFRFHNEAVAAAGLNHPNLVQVYAAGESEGIHWFAMEFVDGESVQARLKRLGKLDPAEALAIGMHVQTALEHGWRKAQLIHRDIKPDNIFLSNDGEVKLGDLGLAKSSDQQQGLTMTGASMGTPLYISPEQAEGKRDIDLRTDIYSLGATLYHLIAGAPPYAGESAISVMMKHVGAPVPDLGELDPSLPPALSALLVKMMQKSPADRYGSYEELGVDLRQAYAALSDSGASAPAAVNGPAVASGAADKRRPAWLLPAVAVPLLGIAAFALLKSKGPSPEEKASPAAPASAPAGTLEAPSVSNKPSGKETVQTSNPEREPTVDAVPELLRKLEAKLLPVPGTDVLMSKTELTVSEWKLYLKGRGLPEWEQHWKEREKEKTFKRSNKPNGLEQFLQTDEHPLFISFNHAKEMCDWISAKTGKEWRMPTNREWEAAAGTSKYPWGEYYPPHWDDGNYAVLDDGTRDPGVVGLDGIRGTAPVGSFKPNLLGFYDLGGNVSEWMADGVNPQTGSRVVRGAGFASPMTSLITSNHDFSDPETMAGLNGFRIVRVKTTAEKAATPSAAAAYPPAATEKIPAQQSPIPAVVQAPPTPQAPPVSTPQRAPQPPKGFRPLFDGATLNGWRGLNPHEVLKAALEQKNALVQKQNQEFPNHWRVENGDLVTLGNGPYATTFESFGNIDLLLEYKTVPGADSGIYLRGTPQIQIWDTTEKDTRDRRPSLGSGGLYNNAPGSPGKDPLVHADKPFGQWNLFRIRQIDSRTWVWLNEQLVVDAALWEPFWNKTKPLPEKAPIMLQTSGGEIRWRNIFVREIPDSEAREILKTSGGAANLAASKTDPKSGSVSEKGAKFVEGPWKVLFDGKTLSGWRSIETEQPQPGWSVPSDALHGAGKRSFLLTTEIFGDFELELQWRVGSNGNGGIFYWMQTGSNAKSTAPEFQLNDSAQGDKFFSGALYHLIRETKDASNPVGSWNTARLVVRGGISEHWVNSQMVCTYDWNSPEFGELKKSQGPTYGQIRRGCIGLQSNSGDIDYKNIRIRTLEPKK
jgi:formylglycine-generating enzyme required for sulfatase activity/tRNA A-37 threonylcarbamoyl transferase component Bud32